MGLCTRRSGTGDAALAAAIGVIQVGGTYLSGRHQTDRESFDVVAGLLLAVGPAALVVRRHYPVPVYLTAFTATLTYVALSYPQGPIFLSLIAAFLTTVVAGHRVVAWTMLAVGYVSFLSVGVVVLDERGPGWARPLAWPPGCSSWPEWAREYG